jgi:hypothetical protein
VGGDRPLRRGIAGRPQGKLTRGVRALYRGAPTLADLDEAGLTLDSDEIRQVNPDGWFYCDEAKDWRCGLWADNWPAVRFYTRYLSTQWRHGYSGPTGLDYNVLLHELDRRGLPPDEYDDLFDSLRVIEQVALDEMHKPLRTQ